MKTEDIEKLKFLDLEDGTVWTYKLEDDISKLQEKLKTAEIEIMTSKEFNDEMCHDNEKTDWDFRDQIDPSWGRCLYKTNKGGLYYDWNKDQGIMIPDCEYYDFPRT
jgi:hypothetical protein